MKHTTNPEDTMLNAHWIVDYEMPNGTTGRLEVAAYGPTEARKIAERETEGTAVKCGMLGDLPESSALKYDSPGGVIRRVPRAEYR